MFTQARYSLIRNFVLILLSCIACTLLLEGTLAAVYYHYKYKEKPMALLQTASSFKNKLALHQATKHAQKATVYLPRNIWTTFYGELGRELLEQFSQEYEKYFVQLLEQARGIRAKVLVVYIPRGEDTACSPSRRFCQPFFQSLAERHSVDLFNLTEVLTAVPADQAYLLPFDSHLSRMGCQLVATALAAQLTTWKNYRSLHTFPKEKVPQVLADLAPHQRTLWNIKPAVPFLLITDRYGFRRDQDAPLNTELQKILILGDSMGFCPYLPNHDTWPLLLQKLLPWSAVLNAAIPGYTIMDETGLFVEKAQFISPDVVILEVFDNDLYDFFSFKRNEFDRKLRTFAPSQTETAFLEQVHKQSLPP